jgi:hypothetical protein
MAWGGNLLGRLKKMLTREKKAEVRVKVSTKKEGKAKAKETLTEREYEGSFFQEGKLISTIERWRLQKATLTKVAASAAQRWGQLQNAKTSLMGGIKLRWNRVDDAFERFRAGGKFNKRQAGFSKEMATFRKEQEHALIQLEADVQQQIAGNRAEGLKWARIDQVEEKEDAAVEELVAFRKKSRASVRKIMADIAAEIKAERGQIKKTASARKGLATKAAKVKVA